MIPQEIKDKIEAYVQAQKTFASSEGLQNIRSDVEHGYSLALPTIEAQAERIKQLEEALDGLFVKWMKQISHEKRWYPLFKNVELDPVQLRSLFLAAKSPVEALNDLSTAA